MLIPLKFGTEVTGGALFKSLNHGYVDGARGK